MKVREHFEGAGDDRTFLAILVSGLVISLLISFNSISFGIFAARFIAIFLVTVLIASAYRFIETRWMKVGALIIIILASSITGLTFLYGKQSCLAWSAHSAENPVTGQCKAYVYGGCGPKPSPWYYSSCSTDSKQAMCDRLANADSDRKQKLEQHLCTSYPDLDLSTRNYNSQNETLTLTVTESDFSLRNTEKLRIEPSKRGNMSIRSNGTLYNTSVLLSENSTSVFDQRITAGDSFTIVIDGTDLDKDGVKGFDYEQNNNVLIFEWWNSEHNGTDVAVAMMNRSKVREVSQLY